ncbi:splicing factor 1-like isoform X2 [Rhopilema esculentum]|uniref:splicing factor 1-like isoform X2 n=1 Tax=Rhopilema esculentum TaxID=499914 RepID=UPI0031D2EFAF
MPFGGSGANKAPLGPLNPILLGQKKESGGQSLLAQHLKRRDDSEKQRQYQGDNQQSNYKQSNYGQQGGYNQGFAQTQGGYGNQQTGYSQQQTPYNQQQGSYSQQQDSYSQQQAGYNQSRDFNDQRNYSSQPPRPAFDDRNQQPKPLMSLPSQPPYNQYSNPPSSQNQPQTYVPAGSTYPMPPASYNPPSAGSSNTAGYLSQSFGGPPPPPPPEQQQNSIYPQPPLPFGGPPLPPSGSSQVQQPPPPTYSHDSYGKDPQPPPPLDIKDNLNRPSPPRKRKRRSRWGDEEEKTQIPGMPASLPVDATEEQREEYLLHFKIEEISIKLRSGDLGIPPNPEDRSPSPEPIYNTEGKRLNTREYRVRKRLEEERHSLIQIATLRNNDYKPPIDYRPPSNRIQEKVMIPQDANPAINFIGLLIGPRGNTLKKMEKDTNCKIIIRGKGSVKEGKGRPGFPLPGENEPLHALVTGPTTEDVKNAVKVIEKIIKEGVETPEGSNELRKMQLRELAALNGTLIEEDIQRCRNCGATDHRHWECTEVKNVTSQIVCTKCGGMGHVAKDCTFATDGEAPPQPSIVEKAKMDDEYMSLMAELGVDAPPPAKPTPTQSVKQDVSVPAAPVEQTVTTTPARTQTSPAPWSAEPKPLMSTNTPFNQRSPAPRPLMQSGGSPVPASGWNTPRGALPFDQTPPSAGRMGRAAPWAQGPPMPPSSMRGPPPPTSNAVLPGPPPAGAPPPWQAGPLPPWQQSPQGAAPFPPAAGYGMPPPGTMYPHLGQTPPIPPWSAPPPPPPPPSK